MNAVSPDRARADGGSAVARASLRTAAFGCGPVRAALRDATRRAHAALHRAPAFAGIGDPGFTGENYAALLSALWRFHVALLPACDLGAAALQVPWLADLQRHRIARLYRDIEYLAAPPADRPLAALDLAIPGCQIGALYVVLGSTLGGAELHRRLAQLLPTPAGREFFAGSPQEAAGWQKFCESLERFGMQAERLPALIAGANATFAYFSSCLEAAA